jgi:osmoprotectant transport system permease protein
MSGLLDFFSERGDDILRGLGEHVYLVVVAMSLAAGLAIPLGLALTRARRVADKVIAAVGVVQTLPSLALVGLMLPLMGGGPKAAITALFLYALLPIVRNTYAGVMAVDPAITEAARGMGMTSRQVLLRVELPLSLPIIMAGLRTSTIICVGIATLGGIIGAGGLGKLIWIGIDRAQDSLVYAGAVPAMGLALTLDGILALGEKALTPEGVAGEAGR